MGLGDEYIHFRATRTSRQHVIDGRSWRLLERPGHGQALLLLHDAIGDEAVFFRIFKHLPSSVRVVALCMPRIDKVQLLADDIVRIMQSLALERPIVLGAGVGAFVAGYLASIRTDLTGLILSSPLIARSAAVPCPMLLNMLAPFGDGLFRLLARRSLARWPRSREAEIAFHDLLLSTYLPDQSARQLASRLKILTRQRYVPRLSKERVLIIQANDDPLVGRRARAAVAEAYPEAIRLDLDWGGHFPYVTRPREFAAIIMWFMQHCRGEGDGTHEALPPLSVLEQRLWQML